MSSEIMTLLNNESIGGNAGAVEIDGKKYNCAGANGYIDRWTGEIIGFANFPARGIKNLSKKDIHFILRIAIDFKKLGFFKVVDKVVDEN